VGVSCALPLFLYLREGALARNSLEGAAGNQAEEVRKARV